MPPSCQWRRIREYSSFPPPSKLITENGHIESFNGRLRDECLNLCALTSIEDVRQKLAAWRIGYNERRPHSSLGNLTQSQFVK